jgi:threonine/homoserine efflux transporter RhtA
MDCDYDLWNLSVAICDTYIPYNNEMVATVKLNH